jgi:hypothetical protein
VLAKELSGGAEERVRFAAAGLPSRTQPRLQAHMFGRSTSSRFAKESKDYTPGPGDYNAKELSTTKRGVSMGHGVRMSIQPTSEFAHLGPGVYSVGAENSSFESRRGAALRTSAVDYDAALKKLAASFTKVMGPMGGIAAQQRELTREDISSLAGKLIGDSLSACNDSIRLKGELDGINSRVKDEVQAALKPSKSTGNAGNPAAWKIYMPLEKAVDNASADLAKKLSKLSSFLALLHDDFPSLSGVLSDGDRIGHLSHAVETLEADLEEALRQSAASAEAAEQTKTALQRELAVYKRNYMQQQVRADKLEELLLSQKDIAQSLEEQLEASHAQQEALWTQVLAQEKSDLDEVPADTAYQHLFDQCKESRDAHEQTLQELHSLQARMTQVMVQNEEAKSALEELMMAAADEACSRAGEMLDELDECRSLLVQSHRDKRIIRGNVTALEERRRALQACMAAGAAELATLCTYLADGEAHPHCQATPQRLGSEALEAVSHLDRSLTDDVLALQIRVEELTEALAVSEEQLAQAQLELTELQREAAARSEDAHE